MQMTAIAMPEMAFALFGIEIEVVGGGITIHDPVIAAVVKGTHSDHFRTAGLCWSQGTLGVW